MENYGTSEDNDSTFDPGTARYGNFINYYSFNPTENRMRLLPNFIQFVHSSRTSPNIICLDVGCNTGELSQELHKYMAKLVGGTSECHILGVDIDEILIQRANENNQNELLTFKCANVLEENFKTVCENYLNNHGRQRFDVIFCFSITMWIHLNHGDDGLKHFVTSLSDASDMLVVEPQPWRCYTRAVRRMKRNNIEPFVFFEKLKIRREVENYIDDLLIKDCNFTKVLQSSPTKWGRQINIYKRNS